MWMNSHCGKGAFFQGITVVKKETQCLNGVKALK